MKTQVKLGDAMNHYDDDQAGLHLPFNRKERYFTATVLPAIIGCEDFKHLGRFAVRCDLPQGVVAEAYDWPSLQFFTEYGFAESVFTPDDKLLWPDTGGRDTPDLVISGETWLITVEAKMYLNPTATELTKQVNKQASVIETWLRHKPAVAQNSAHVLLLPAQLVANLGTRMRDVPAPVVTWQQVLADYEGVAPKYWLDVLREALASYDALVGHGGPSGQNSQDKLKGSVIFTQYARGQLPFDHVGRQGGLKKFREDVADNEWKGKRYEVRSGPPPSTTNWFTIDEFVNEVLPGTLAVPTFPPRDDIDPGDPKPIMRHAYFDGADHHHRAIQFAQWCQTIGGATQVQVDDQAYPNDATGVFDKCTRVFYVMPHKLDLDPAIGNALRLMGGEPIPVTEYPGFLEKYTHTPSSRQQGASSVRRQRLPDDARR